MENFFSVHLCCHGLLAERFINVLNFSYVEGPRSDLKVEGAKMGRREKNGALGASSHKNI